MVNLITQKLKELKITIKYYSIFHGSGLISIIYYDNVKTIGSGDLQSQGNTRQDLRVQLNYRY